MKTKHYVLIAGLMFLMGGLVAFRMYLPTWIKNTANTRLSQMAPYRGHIEQVELSFLDLKLMARGFQLEKGKQGSPVMFLKVSELAFSLLPRELWQGHFVVNIDLQEPELTLVKLAQASSKPTSSSQKKTNVPLKLNQISLRDGRLNVLDKSVQPPLAFEIYLIRGEAVGLNPDQAGGRDLPATIKLSGEMNNKGHIDVDLRLNPSTTPVRFAFAGRMKNLDLLQLNPFFKAYGHFDVEKGALDIYTELAGDGHTLEGYIKPMITNLKVVDPQKDSKQGFFHLVWEGIVGAAAQILENRDKDNQAARIPLKGRMDGPKADLWVSVSSVFRNAFVHAIPSGVEGSVQLDNKPKK